MDDRISPKRQDFELRHEKDDKLIDIMPSLSFLLIMKIDH